MEKQDLPLPFEVHGSKNPVTVALRFLLAAVGDGYIDVPSFLETSALVGDVEAPGFMVTDLLHLSQLCALGGFQILIDCDGYHARR